MHHLGAWKQFKIAPCKTYHEFQGRPAYTARFLHVMKYHAPGVAPVRDETGAYHIDVQAQPIYKERYLQSFGYYQQRAAVAGLEGWFHIKPNGRALYDAKYAWCGNFQEGFAPVKDAVGKYFHINWAGKKAYPAQFAYAGDFRDGLAVVQNEQGYHAHIDAAGQFIYQSRFYDLDVFHKGYARAKDEEGWFHIDMAGQEMYAKRFQSVEPFYNGFSRVETFAGELCLLDETGNIVQQLRPPLHDPFHQASGELVSYWRLETLRTAIALRLFDQLPQIAPQYERLLLALQEMGFVFQERGEWRTTDKGAYFVKNHPHSLAKASQLWLEEHQRSWRDLAYALETKKSAFEKNYGQMWFDYIAQDEPKNKHYHEVIATYASRDYPKIVEILDLSQHRSIVDMGGSTGCLLFTLLTRWEHLQGELLDLPEVCEKVLIPKKLTGRVHLVPANFFGPWPTLKSDAAILTRVLHDWADEEALHILLHIPCDTLYIVEYLLDKKRGRGALLDLNMLVMTGGKERTYDEFAALLNRAGFKLDTSHPLNEVATLLVAKKCTT